MIVLFNTFFGCNLFKLFRCRLYTVYNLNYTPTLGVQSWREITSGCTRTKKKKNYRIWLA
jgi:hypothetical protein